MKKKKKKTKENKIYRYLRIQIDKLKAIQKENHWNNYEHFKQISLQIDLNALTYSVKLI